MRALAALVAVCLSWPALAQEQKMSAMPAPSATSMGGSFARGATAHQFLTSLGVSGNLVSGQPLCADLSDVGVFCNSTDAGGLTGTVTGAAYRPAAKTVATLPACAGGNEGVAYVVTDALLPALSVAVAGGGAVHIEVTCLATLWKVTKI